MALSRQVVEQIKDLLRQNPQGLSITDIARIVDINRNTAGRYLDKLLLSGQVEMHHFGMAKLFRLSERLPVSAVLSISSELVLQLDSSLRIIFINDPFLQFIRATAKDIVGKNIEYTVISSVFEDIFSDLLVRLREGVAGTEWRGELSLPERGTVFFCRIAPTVFNEGPKGVSVLFEDISDRKRDEEQIRQSEARVRSIIRVAPIGIGVIRNRVFLEVNARFCQITGYSAAELLGQSAGMLYLTREEYDRVGVVKYGLIRDRGTGSVETQWRRKDKKIIDVLVSSTPLDPADLSSGVTFTALDITERKRAEKALLESEAKLRSIAENSPDLILLLNPELEIIFISRTFTQNFNEVRGRPVYDYIPQEYHAAAAACFDHVLKTGKPAIYITEYHFATGKTVHFESTVGPVFQEKTVAALVINARDITERKNAEKEIAESEDRYRNLVEISPDAVILHREGTIIFINPAGVCLLGARNPEEIIGKSVFEFIQPDYREAVRTNIKKDLGGEKTPPIELQMFQIDGTPIIVEGRGVKTYFDGKPAVQVAMHDITERKKREDALRASEERYRRLLEQSFDAIAIHKEGKITLVNDATVAIMGGSSPEEFIGRSIYDFIHPDSQPVAKERLSRDTGTLPLVKEKFVRIDGTPVDVEVMSTWFMDNGIPAVQVVFRKIPSY
jgi:two-component system, NarL family, sensor histidine kinase ComP